MKWFHHECAAKHDPKLQTIGATLGAEGLGIYWGLLEEIGQHSDSFHLKVSGVSLEIDQKFSEMCSNCASTDPDLVKIPRISLKILARVLFTSPRKLTSVLQTCIEVGLFDSAKWREYNLLYSPSFEHRADDYTRRQQRKSDSVRTESAPHPDNVRTQSGESSNTLRTISGNVLLEQTRTEGEQNKPDEKRTSLLAVNVESFSSLSTHNQQPANGSGHYLIDPSPEEFIHYGKACKAIVQKWNTGRASPFDWDPNESELKKLFYAGNHQHKVSMCYQAFNIQGDKVNYPELVLRAVRLMLKASQKQRIVNPFGWLWTCLHGNGDGTTPWVQLLSAEEESTTVRSIRRFVPVASDHPP